MAFCFAIGYNHRTGESQICSPYRFRVDASKKKKWVDRCRRADRDINNNDRRCSCYFEEGENGLIFLHLREENRLEQTVCDVPCPMEEAVSIDQSYISTSSHDVCNVEVPVPATQYSEKVQELENKVEELEKELSLMKVQRQALTINTIINDDWMDCDLFVS